MNRTKLKNYAPQARRDFIQAMTDRAAFYGLTETTIEPVLEQGDVAVIGGRSFPRAVARKRKALEERIAKQGFGSTMEAMAYTWFNRLVAIRFMELHGYLDHGYRVLSHPEGKPTPEILEQAEHVQLPGLKKDAVIDLKLAGNKESELYRLLLTAQCNALNKAMPFLFEKIDDETELLLPDNLLHSDSLIRKLVGEIDEEDWQEVEIIGWLYQFYISEKKDQVIGKVVASEDIPAATQLFTPNWIVKYLVQNTLGRQWLATYPQSALRQQMAYYIEPAEQTPEVQEQLKAITPTSLNPEEELTLLDPACGSGHILVEAYDLFKAIYQERGYQAKVIPALILQKNLFGLEIDDRAAQLAAFALMMKARADDRRLFDSEAKPNVVAIQDSQGLSAADITHALNSPINNEGVSKESLFEEIDEENRGLFSKQALAEKGHVSQADIVALIELFENGKTFGSLIQIPPKLAAKLPEIEKRLDDVLKNGDLTHASAHVIRPLLEQARFFAKQYDVLSANPPYMGAKNMPLLLKECVGENYALAKADLFSAFITRGILFTKQGGHHAMVTMHAWMFLASFEEFRNVLLTSATITSLAHLGARAFSMISGEVVQTVAFSMKKVHLTAYTSSFLRLIDGDEDAKQLGFSDPRLRFNRGQDKFFRLPGQPLAYWITDRVFEIFAKEPRLGAIADARPGLQTSDNARFLRLWHEIDFDTIGFNCASRAQSQESCMKWFPCNKGGPFRRWYGNVCHVVNWQDDGRELFAFARSLYGSPTRIIKNADYYFRKGITWSDVTMGDLSFRFMPTGHIFDATGHSAFFNDDAALKKCLGLMNTTFMNDLSKVLNPTFHFHVGYFRNLPYASSVTDDIVPVVTEAIELSKRDWDSSECSWDFTNNSLVALRSMPGCGTTSSSWLAWEIEANSAVNRLVELEAENNRAFVKAFGLEAAVQPAVHDQQVSLLRPDRIEDIKRLLSYAIGCMMGRYSLDKPGLILASQGETLHHYLLRTSTTYEPLSAERAISTPESVVFAPGILPRCFNCGTLSEVGNARFVIAGHYEGESLRGKPLVYCSDCCDGSNATYVTWQQPLSQFSVSQALQRKWCEPDTLKIFLELARCFVHQVPRRPEEVSFPPDEDGIIPLLETDWGIRDDATSRFVEFISVAWPREHLEDNLKFVADSLGANNGEQPRETIRRYLAGSGSGGGFYKHHLSMYKKRPIYWLFSSGKQRAFQCLVYLHRYHEGTLSRMRTEYVIPLQGQIAARIEQLEGDKAQATSTSHRTKLQKEQDRLKKQQAELATFEEKLKHYADQRIPLDLDDGVKVNYAKFGDLLAESKAITGGKDEE